MIGEAAALGSALTWAMSSILMGSASARMPAVVIATVRALIGSLFIFAVVGALSLTGDLHWPPPGILLALAASGALGVGLGDTLYIGSLPRIGVSRAHPISTAVYPLLTVGLAVALLGETITPPVALGSILVVAGVYLVITERRGARETAPVIVEPAPDAALLAVGAGVGGAAPSLVQDSQPPSTPAYVRPTGVALGIAMALAASTLWAVASVWLRAASTDVQPVLAQVVRLPAALLVTAPLAGLAGLGVGVHRHGRRTLVALLLTGIVGTGVGSILWVVAVQGAGAGRAAVLSSTSPLFALPLASLALGERLTARIVAGTAASILGVILVI